jgi:hypothetical protein
MEDTYDIPKGYCHCTCGRKTKLAPYTSRARGWIKGEPLRFIYGHNSRKRHRVVVVDTGWSTPCHVWQLSKTRGGYGQVRNSSAGMSLAHRVSYEEQFGPIPPGLQLDHLCRVRACVNPEHLEVVTSAQNVRRGNKAKLSWQQVAEIRTSSEKQTVLAARYGVTQGHVSRIKSGLTWRSPSSSLTVAPAGFDCQCDPPSQGRDSAH